MSLDHAFLLSWSFINVIGIGLYFAALSWLLYISFEPYVRRRWPHLLISWVRAIDGRCRDPLVGQAILWGILSAVAAAVVWHAPAAVSRLIASPQVPLTSEAFLVPLGPGVLLVSGVLYFVTVMAPGETLQTMGMLFLARLIARRDSVALLMATVIVSLLMFGNVREGHQSGWTAVIAAVLFTAINIAALWKGGLLGLAVYAIAGSVLGVAPLTTDLSRWYAWRGALMVAAIVALAVWGFRNVLGRQSVLPESALED